MASDTAAPMAPKVAATSLSTRSVFPLPLLVAFCSGEGAGDVALLVELDVGMPVGVPVGASVEVVG